MILFNFIFNFIFVKILYFFHFLNDFIIDWHWMKPYNYPYYFGFDVLKIDKKFELSHFWDRDSFFWICYEHFSNNFSWLQTNIAWYNIKAFNHLFIKLFCCIFLKRKGSTYHTIKNDPKRPKITNETVITISWNHLWRCITRASTCSVKILSFLWKVGQTKIDQLYIVVSI